MKQSLYIGMLFLLLTGIGFKSSAQKMAGGKSETDFAVPNGFVLFEEIHGDLNGDGIDDQVLIVKETKAENIVINRFDQEVDRNRRGIVILLSKIDGYETALENLTCFSSENEDGGVYYPAQLSFEIEKGKLLIHYEHGRYGFWRYVFSYQNADFDLIGFDSSHTYGPIINRETSINFLSKKKLIRENINQDTEGSGEEVFEETWSVINIARLIKLSEIPSFEAFDGGNARFPK